MNRKIEIYNDNSNTNKLTITQERITIKVSKYHEKIDFSNFANLINDLFVDTKNTLRSRILYSFSKNEIFTFIGITKKLIKEIRYNITTKEFICNDIKKN